MHRYFYPISKTSTSLPLQKIRSHWLFDRNIDCSNFTPELIYKHYKIISLTTSILKTLENKWCTASRQHNASMSQKLQICQAPTVCLCNHCQCSCCNMKVRPPTIFLMPSGKANFWAYNLTFAYFFETYFQVQECLNLSIATFYDTQC